MILVEGAKVTALRAGETWHGTFHRYARNGLAWVWLPGAGESTDLFLLPVDDIEQRAA